MDILPYVFAGVLVVLTIVMTVVGVQLFLVLHHLKKSLVAVNTALESASSVVSAVTAPLQQLSATAKSVQTGFRVLETFSSWLQKNKQK